MRSVGLKHVKTLHFNDLSYGLTLRQYCLPNLPLMDLNLVCWGKAFQAINFILATIYTANSVKFDIDNIGEMCNMSDQTIIEKM